MPRVKLKINTLLISSHLRSGSPDEIASDISARRIVTGIVGQSALVAVQTQYTILWLRPTVVIITIFWCFWLVVNPPLFSVVVSLMERFSPRCSSEHFNYTYEATF